MTFSLSEKVKVSGKTRKRVQNIILQRKHLSAMLSPLHATQPGWVIPENIYFASLKYLEVNDVLRQESIICEMRSVFVNKVLLEASHVRWFLQCLRPLLCDGGQTG